MVENGSITGELRRMEVGEKREYPAEKILSLRTLASSLGFVWDRKYSTRIDRRRRIATVTRER